MNSLTMLKPLPPLGLAALLSLASCHPKSSPPAADPKPAAAEEEEKGKTGTFTVEGKESTGKMSIQRFPATGEFSIICQDDSTGLIQLTFTDEPSARTPGVFQLTERMSSGLKDKATADLSFQTFGIGSSVSSRGSGAGSVTVTKSAAGNEVTFSNVLLSSVDGKSQRSVSGKLSY